MSDFNVIGLCGYAGAGKDTIAEILVDEGWYRVAYADKLKELAWVSNPIVDLNAEDLPVTLQQFAKDWGAGDMDVIEKVDLAKRHSAWGRTYLQTLGNGMREIFGDDFWRRQLEVEIDRVFQEQGQTKFVITDIRYPNELGPVERLYSIVRPGVGPVNGHVSETNFETLHNLADFGIFNDGTPTEAAQEILGTLTDLD